MKVGRGISAAAVAAFMSASASLASAGVLYSNGPINGTIDAWTINFGYAVEDSFTLTSAATVTGVTFGAWTDPGDVITGVDWGIASTAGSYADDGSATVTTGAYFGQGFGYYDIYTYSFSIAPTSLAAGTYYLTLQKASVSNGDPGYWDENDGPSTAMENTVGSIGSESFSVTNSVPEPSTWAMMALGFVGLGFAGYRKTNRNAAVAA